MGAPPRNAAAPNVAALAPNPEQLRTYQRRLEAADTRPQAPPIPGAFVCNIGDMLDRLTGGLFRSTPHRVRNPAPRDRLSFPFFFDPGFDTRVQAIELPGAPRTTYLAERWDRENVHAFDGSYGDYLLRKVGRVFPELDERVLG